MLPLEAEDLRCLEQVIRGVFRSFGYGEVITPAMETEAAMERAAEQRIRSTYRCIDGSGDYRLLRPEMTIPIARLVSTWMAGRQLPLRLCYFANSFSPAEPQPGRRSEFRQAGLELIGEDAPAMDAEVLAVLCRALDACGLEDYSICLGEASFLKALLEAAGMSADEREAVFARLRERDLVALARVVADLDIASGHREAILEVVTLRGGSEVLARAQDLSEGGAMDEALKRLARIFYLLTRQGLAHRVLFDFGVLGDFDYYTGLVLEVLSPRLGCPIGGGGRYDGLLARFGMPSPAVGFAIGLERLQLALGEGRGLESQSRRSAVLIGGMDESLDLAEHLRQSGIDVLCLAHDIGADAARQVAVENGVPFVISVTGDGLLLNGVAGGETRCLDMGGLLTAMGVDDGGMEVDADA